MTSLADLRPGDIGFGPIHGGAGLLVNAGQLMLGEAFHVGKLDIRHVFVVTGASPGLIPLDDDWPHLAAMPVVTAVEAEPGGAVESEISDRWTSEYAYVRLPEDYPGQADDAAAIAREMVGTPYSFASYVALAAWKWGLATPRLERWINRRRPPRSITMPSSRTPFIDQGIALPAEAICSVLADQAWSLTGKKIMQGLPHQCVTPGALAQRLLEYPGAEWMWPA